MAGHSGLVGSGILRRLEEEGFGNLVYRTRSELDLASDDQVERFFAETRPEVVIIAAGKVGGIAANIAQPVEFLVDNIKVQNNLLLASQRHAARKTLFLGSSCIYPREAPQPMTETSFMRGPLEPTNESYAIAKIAGIRLAQALNQQFQMHVINLLPCNVYGPGDHFEFERSHVVSALVRRFVMAVQDGQARVSIWGTGSARREFIHVDDLADACLFLLDNYDSPDIINIGTGEDHSIKELAEMIAGLAGFDGDIAWDTSKPDGMPRKLLDVHKLNALGWSHKIPFSQGLKEVIEDFHERFPRGVSS